jgi:hypothetical protein
MGSSIHDVVRRMAVRAGFSRSSNSRSNRSGLQVGDRETVEAAGRFRASEQERVDHTEKLKRESRARDSEGQDLFPVPDSMTG